MVANWRGRARVRGDLNRCVLVIGGLLTRRVVGEPLSSATCPSWGDTLTLVHAISRTYRLNG